MVTSAVQDPLAASRHTCPNGWGIRVASEREELKTRIDGIRWNVQVEKL